MASPQFFKKTPRKGLPISLEGIADGLQRLQYAFQHMTVHNGEVQWLGFAPKIVVEGTGTAGDGLPSGGEQYQVLQRDDQGAAVWDWVRAAPDA